MITAFTLGGAAAGWIGLGRLACSAAAALHGRRLRRWRIGVRLCLEADLLKRALHSRAERNDWLAGRLVEMSLAELDVVADLPDAFELISVERMAALQSWRARRYG